MPNQLRTIPSQICDGAISASVVVITLVYLCFQGQHKRWSAVASFTTIFGLYILAHGLQIYPGILDWRVCLLAALVGSNIVALPSSNHSVSNEGFATEEHEHMQDDYYSDDAIEENDAEYDDDGSDSGSDGGSDYGYEDEQVNSHPSASSTKRTNKRRRHKKLKRRGNDLSHSKRHHYRHTDSDQTDESRHRTTEHHSDEVSMEEDTKDGYVDTFSTFMETYKSLNPNQVEKMTTDTRELIQTQKQLMKTVESFAPVLKEGREMMNTFKEYFGQGADTAMKKALNGGKD